MTASIEVVVKFVFEVLEFEEADTPPGRGRGVCNWVAILIMGLLRFKLSANPEEDNLDEILESSNTTEEAEAEVEVEGSDIPTVSTG